MKKIFIILSFISLGIFAQVPKLNVVKSTTISNLVLNLPSLEKGSLPSTLAAPVNDNCANAIQITTLNGTCNGAYTLNSATTDLYSFGCQTNTKQVWFYFVAQGPNVEITVQGGTITDPEIVLFAGTNICTASPTITYGGYCASYWPFSSTSVSLTNQTCTNPLTVGQTYYFTVDSWGTKGTFCVSVNNPTANPAGTDCGTATTVCSNTTFSGNANLWGSCDLNTTTQGGCLGQYGEVNSSWYILYVDPTSPANATLTFTISPSNGTDDYDYSIWKGATCTLGAPNNCNFSSTVANTGLQSGSASTSQGSGGTPWNAPLTTQPSDVYILLINGYTPSSSNYSLSFGGTAILGCNPPPILPIELTSFTGEQYGEYNLLKWTTASEINNKQFTIERSVNAIDFNIVDYVKGAGTSTLENKCSLIDTKPFVLTYYRLTQTDFNGSSKNADIIAVTRMNNGKDLKLIRISNLMGQEVTEDYEGVKIYIFNDGSVVKKYKINQ